VSVLTHQVEAQGEKIRDLENSLGEYQRKLSCTEQMLQQVLVIFIKIEDYFHMFIRNHLKHLIVVVNPSQTLREILVYMKGSFEIIIHTHTHTHII